MVVPDRFSLAIAFSLSAEPEKKRYIKFETPSILYAVVPLATLMEKLEAPALYIWDCDNAGELLVNKLIDLIN